MVLPSGQFVDLLHIGINDIGYRLIEAVDSLFRLEEDIGVLGSTTCHRMFWVESPVTKFL